MVYLHFPFDWLDQRDRLMLFTQVVQRAGGIAVKVESSAVAHDWNRWFALLSGTAFDAYCAAVTLVTDSDCYFSCGMHHFKLPECSVPLTIAIVEAADLMHRFNMYQIEEQPRLMSGHTFGVAADAPRLRLTLSPDSRHEVDDLFHNPHGVWCLNFKS